MPTEDSGIVCLKERKTMHMSSLLIKCCWNRSRPLKGGTEPTCWASQSSHLGTLPIFPVTVLGQNVGGVFQV